MHLVIDIGNTLVKVAVFDLRRLVIRKNYSVGSLKGMSTLLVMFNEIDSAIYSSVTKEKIKNKLFITRGIKLHELNLRTQIPIKNKYSTPSTLGKDRLANAVGVASINRGKNSLVVDVGTCLKFDFVNSKNEYLGGAISPGLFMRYQALHHFTDKLPKVSPSQKSPDLIGDSTQRAIRSGVQQGMLAEITGVIEEYKKRFKNLHVYLTGGDASYFEPQLKKTIFAPDLTLYGLNEILLFRTKK